MPSWLNHGVVGAIEWPRVEVSFKFGEYEILAKPPTKDQEASLHMELIRNKIDYLTGMSVLSRVLSLATWVDDAYSILLDGWSGNPVPVAVPRTSNSFPSSILDAWTNARQPLVDLDARRAIAIYREATVAEQYHSIPHAALGYFKILEIRYQGKPREQWLETEIVRLRQSGSDDVNEVARIAGGTPKQIAKFLYDQGRNAVAHTNLVPTIDPDDIAQVRHLSTVLPLLHTIARTFIRKELGVSEGRWEK